MTGWRAWRLASYAPYGSSFLTCLSFALSSGSIRSNARFTRGAFLRRLWDFMPLVRKILPVAVILNRFLAPLCVLSFGFTPLSLFLALTLFRLQRIEKH